MKNFQGKKILLIIFFLLIFAGGIIWINKDIYHFESIHLIGRSFSEDEAFSDLYRLTAQETLKRGTYSIEYIVESPSPEEHYVLMEGEEIIAEGEFDGNPVQLKIDKSSQQITAGIIFGGNNKDFYVAEINYYSDHVLTRDSFLYHLSLSACLCLLVFWLIFRLVFPEQFRRTAGKILTPERERLLIFFLVFTILICIPFYRPEYVKGDDSTYHMARIEGLKATLEKGIFPPRIYLFYLNGYGYPGGIFYPDIMLYFPAVLRLLGFNFILTYKIFIFVLNFLDIVSIYFCVSRITGKRLPGITASVLYGLNAYRLIDVFYRGAVGELQAFIFIPLIILGLFYIFSGKTKRWWILAMGCTGLVLSHLISCILCAIMMSIFFLINIRKIIHSREIISALAKSFLISAALCAYFILPLAEQLLTNEVISSHTYSGGIPLFALLANKVIWDIPVRPYIGYPLLFGCLIFLFPQTQPNGFRKTILYTALFALFGFFCATSLFPWKLLPWLNIHIQFPWRFFIPAIPLLIIAETLTFKNRFSEKEQKIFLVILSVFCILSVIPIYQSAFTRWMESRGYVMENNRTGSNMYLPEGFEPDFIDKNRDTVLSTDPEFETVSHKRGNLSFSFEFTVRDKHVGFEIPLLYYTGYQAELTTGSGSQMLDTSRSDNGLIKVSIDDTYNGSITARYQKTLAQHVGDIITLSVIVCCLVYILVIKRRTNK